MEKAEVAAVDDEPRWANVGLDDVFRFGLSVFKAGGDVASDGVVENLVKLGSLDFEVTSGVDFGGEFEEFSNVLAGFAAGNENGGVREEVEIALELVEDGVDVVCGAGGGEAFGFVGNASMRILVDIGTVGDASIESFVVVGIGAFSNEVGLGEDNDNSLSGFDDLAGEGLVEFGMRFGGVDEEGADVGFFDCGEGAEGGEFFDADFAFAGLTEASGVEDFDSAAVEFNFDAVNIAGSSLAGADDGLLFAAEGVEETGFADVGSADES